MNISLLALIGCRSESGVEPADVSVPEPIPLALAVDAPISGAFVGRAAEVSGSVTDPGAEVWIEGHRANVGSDGSFRVEVPVGGDFRVIDVEAIRPGDHLRERRPVFSGGDPMAGWTGGLGLRLTPVALDHLAELLEAEVEALDLPGQIDALLPSIALGELEILPTGTTARPPEVALVPSLDGIALTVGLRSLEIGFQVVTPLAEATPVVLGLDEISLQAEIRLGLDQQGLEVEISDTALTLGEPILAFGTLSSTALEALAGGLVAGIGDLLSGALDLGAALLGEWVVPLEGLETDLLGFPLSLSLAEVGTDPDGVGLRLGVDLGALPASAPSVPSSALAGPSADLAIAIHEGLLQGLLDSELLSLLDLDLELPGVLGEVVALPLSALPGGDRLPAERTGICLSVDPGGPRVGRLKPDLAPLAVLTLPDVRASVAVSTESEDCAPWLEASLAVQIALDAEDARLGARIEVADGAVLSYAADPERVLDEDEIVSGLGDLVGVATALLGADIAIDLTELFGGEIGGLPLGELSPRLLDARASGAEGEVVVGVSLWD